MISQIGEFGKQIPEPKHVSTPVINIESPIHTSSNNVNSEVTSNLMASAQCNEAVAALQVSVNQILNDFNPKKFETRCLEFE